MNGSIAERYVTIVTVNEKRCNCKFCRFRHKFVMMSLEMFVDVWSAQLHAEAFSPKRKNIDSTAQLIRHWSLNEPNPATLLVIYFLVFLASQGPTLHLFALNRSSKTDSRK